MSALWNEAPLGDLLIRLFDHRGRTPKKLGGDFSDHGIAVISAKNIRGGRVDLKANLRFIEKEMFDRWMPEKLRAGDVLLTSEAPMGSVAFLDEEADFCLGQRLFALRADPICLDARFLYYMLQSPIVQGRLRARVSGTTAEGIRQAELVQVALPHPDLRAQRLISGVLGAIDDLIENNRRRIALLERMAQAIYREWFVHFRYPGHEEAERLSAAHKSPPKGWPAVALESLLAVHIGGGWGKEQSDSQHTVPAFVIRGTDIPRVRQFDVTRCPRRFHTPTNIAKRALVEHDIVMEVSGGGKEQSVGRSFIVSRELLERFADTTICASFCKRIVVDPEFISPLLVGLGIEEMYRSGAIDRYQVQSTGIKNLKFTAFLREERFAVPPRTLQRSFVDRVEPLLKLAGTAKRSAADLVTCRDMLLPKLVTGAIDVSKIDLDALLAEDGAA